MNRAEFKRMMKGSVHTPSRGTGRTRPKSSQEESDQIQKLTEEYLARGGKIDSLPSEQMRPARSPAFNPSNIGAGAGE